MKTSELKQSLTPCDYGPASGIWALLYQVSFHIRGRRSHPNFRIADDQGVSEWWLAKSQSAANSTDSAIIESNLSEEMACHSHERKGKA